MRRLLFATVATAALLLAAPMATAQYGSPAQPETTQTQAAPYTQPDMPPPVETPATVQPNEAPAYAPTTTTTPDNTVASEATIDTTTSAQTTTGAATADAQMYDSQSASAADSSAPSSAYGAADSSSMQTQNAAYGPDQSSTEAMLQHAVDAGMSGVPMSAAEVCAPREVELGASSHLSHNNMNKLENAADRASACEIQSVVIRAPDGRGDAIRQTLVAHGFDGARIDVEQGDDTAVQIQFAGVATSSEVYAQLYNGAQYASANPMQPNTMDGTEYTPDPNADTADPMYEPTAGGETYVPTEEQDSVEGEYDF